MSGSETAPAQRSSAVPKKSPQVAAPVTRPRLAFRVGVTGARQIGLQKQERLFRRLGDVLGLVRAQMLEVAKREDARRYYSCDAEGKLTPELYITSPLALGADRLAATVALQPEYGYKLRVPMPFPLEEYQKDFQGNVDSPGPAGVLTAEEDVAEFFKLFHQADESVALDGGGAPGSDLRNRSYEAVGHLVVRHSDLLLAIWDGGAGKGRGGTADVVRYAANAGIPIWWIHSVQDEEPRWLEDIQDLRDPITPNISPAERLRAYLEKLVPMPRVEHELEDEPEHNWIARVARLWSSPAASPALQYFDETGKPGGWLWKTYGRVMKLAAFRLGRKAASNRSTVLSPTDPVTRYWYNQYLPADALAVSYANRYRSTYVLVIGMTALALILGAFAVGCTVAGEEYNVLSLLLALSEVAVLLAIFAFVATSLRFQWQQRSVEYRVLAELFRKQELLAPLGWALSIGAVQHLADSERLTWVPWLFAAVQRAAPMSGGEVSPQARGELSRAQLLLLIREQFHYHHERRKRSGLAGARFESLGAIVFLLVVVTVLLKIIFHRHEMYAATVLCGLAAMVLPGISAAFVALRGYAELQLLTVQSHSMQKELLRSKKRIERLNLQRTLVSQDLGHEAAVVATLMLGDLQGWGQMFRGKTAET